MKQIQISFYLMLGVAIVLPLVGCLWVGQWVLAALFALLGAVWFALDYQKKWMGDRFLLAIYLGLAVMAALMAVGSGWLLLGSTAVVLAWDLHLFGQNLASADLIHQPTAVVQTHLRRLLLVGGAALTVGTAVLLIQLTPDFNILFGISALLILSLSQLIVHFGKNTN